MTFRETHRGRYVITALLLILAMLAPLPVATSPALAASHGPLADFEGSFPADWFIFNGASSVSATLTTVGDADPLARQAQVGDNGVATVDFTVNDFGGFGTAYTAPLDWSSTASFSFWFFGTGSGLTYQAEISDNRSDQSIDTSERFDYEFTDTAAGWQHIDIPWTDFTRATDFQPGGAPDDGLTLTEVYTWAIVLPLGADIVHFDDFAVNGVIVDDFEDGLASGADGDGNPVGFFTFQDPNSTVFISTTSTPTSPVPGSNTPNSVMQVDSNVNGNNGFAGFIHAFENETADTWVTQDWSGYSGLSFWLYGNNTGSVLFVDILDNREPGTTTDTAERWSTDIIDDFSGWQLIEIPFDSLNRKEIGNGAPNDGLGLTQVHGWAFGVFDAGVPLTNYLDDVSLFGVADVAELSVGFTTSSYDIAEGDTGAISVALNRPLGDEDPDTVTVNYSTETILATPDRDYVPTGPGTLTFVKGGASELTFDVETIDDTKHEATERVILRLADPVGAAPGFILQAAANIVDNDDYDPRLLDDFELDPNFWDTTGDVSIDNPELSSDEALALPGQGAFEHVLTVSAPLSIHVVIEGTLCPGGNGVIPVVIATTDSFDATTLDHATLTLGSASEIHMSQGEPTRHVKDADGDGDLDLVLHFRAADTGLDCDATVIPFNGYTLDGHAVTAGGSDAAISRDFPIGQDWSESEALSFWYYGQNSGDEITLKVLDNRVTDSGPDGWDLVWADEFDEAAGTPPNPDNWGYEIGDGIVNGIPGWGNDELQYYTDSPDNAATDGNGNLVITAKTAEGELCYYGECDYTSARLVTTNKAEFAYGRVEARVQVPDGTDGLWPAFWSLGTDIDRVAWPQTGEIDIMEYVSRLPDEIFGTIHGPGYAGGSSFGNIYDFGEPVANDFHTFAIEWQEDRIDWYVDDILYHSATPADVAPNEWVFNDPVYLLLNLAVGGNFGGTVADDLTFPQELTVDYVRVYQADDTAERFEGTFTDAFDGWQEVVVPFDALARSADQPVGAPDDGLTLTDVWGYGFDMPNGLTGGEALLDQVRLVAIPAPTEITVTSLADAGPGSLRQAIEDVAFGGTVLLDASLVDSVVSLAGPLVVSKDVSVDAGAAPGFALSGGGVDRVLIVDPGANVTFSNITLTEGYGFQLAGCVLNNGSLTLDTSSVTGCTMTTDAGDFWQGGGGIYSGDGASLTLVDSTVADNSSGFAGGGVYSFFNTTTTIVRSTISGNTAVDVGGGMRSLGNGTITNSTVSGNTALAWHGGAIFVTDGTIDVINSTIADNVSPGGTADVFVGTFGPSNAALSLTNSIVSSTGANCFVAFFGAGAVTLATDANNVFTDATCFVGASDLVVADAGLAPLSDNGGPTLTHALAPASPAIDAADPGACPATDQRGVARPQGAGCDVGAFEFN